MTGIEDLRFHDLRHEGITRLAEDGLTIPQLQQISLHESWESLRRYVNLKSRRDRLDFVEAMKVAKNWYKKAHYWGFINGNQCVISCSK